MFAGFRSGFPISRSARAFLSRAAGGRRRSNRTFRSRFASSTGGATTRRASEVNRRRSRSARPSEDRSRWRAGMPRRALVIERARARLRTSGSPMRKREFRPAGRFDCGFVTIASTPAASRQAWREICPRMQGRGTRDDSLQRSHSDGAGGVNSRSRGAGRSPGEARYGEASGSSPTPFSEPCGDSAARASNLRRYRPLDRLIHHRQPRRHAAS